MDLVWKTIFSANLCKCQCRRSSATFCLGLRGVELETKLPSNDWREYLGKRKQFTFDLVKEHSAQVDGFFDKLTDNYYRLGRPNGNSSQLTQQQVVELLLDEQSLDERAMAQVSNLWTALTT